MNLHFHHSESVAIAPSSNGYTVHAPNAQAAVSLLRCVLFADSSMIATIAGVTLTGGLPGVHQLAEVEDGLARCLLEIGNSSGDNIVGIVNALQNPHACEPKQDALKGIAEGREVICLASGPSAGPALGWILQRQRAGAVVVCADSIFRGAVSAGISPDFVCVLERDERMAAMVPADICLQTRLICPPVVHPSVVSGWQGRRVWVWQRASAMYDSIGPGIPLVGTGRSAGTLAVMVSLLMHPLRVVLVGHDLCEIGDASHAAAAEDLAHAAHVHDVQNPANTYHRRETVECWDGEHRQSTLFWLGCRDDISAMMTAAQCPVYVHGMKGARIPRTLPVADALPLPSWQMPLRLGAVSSSRYGSHLRWMLIDELHQQCAKIAEAPELGDPADLMPTGSDPYRVTPLLMHIIAIDQMACTLRMHADASAGMSRADVHARAYSLLRRRLPQSYRAALHALEAS